MADKADSSAPQTLKGAIVTVNAKIVLAFFVTIIAAGMVIFLLLVLKDAPPGKIDAGTIALISSMVMLFIKMAADAVGYQYQSSSGSDKKDDVQANVSKALAEKVPTPPPDPAPVAPASVTPWWVMLTDAEKTAITAAGVSDPRVAAFVVASTASAATSDDLAYLVSKGLLTQDRANVIKSA